MSKADELLVMKISANFHLLLNDLELLLNRQGGRELSIARTELQTAQLWFEKFVKTADGDFSLCDDNAG